MFLALAACVVSPSLAAATYHYYYVGQTIPVLQVQNAFYETITPTSSWSYCAADDADESTTANAISLPTTATSEMNGTTFWYIYNETNSCGNASTGFYVVSQEADSEAVIVLTIEETTTTPTTSPTTEPTTTTTTPTTSPTISPSPTSTYPPGGSVYTQGTRSYWWTNTSGNLTAPITGVYHISIIGAGGAGGASSPKLSGSAGEVKDEKLSINSGDIIVAQAGYGGDPSYQLPSSECGSGTCINVVSNPISGGDGGDSYIDVMRNNVVVHAVTAVGGLGGGSSSASKTSHCSESDTIGCRGLVPNEVVGYFAAARVGDSVPYLSAPVDYTSGFGLETYPFRSNWVFPASVGVYDELYSVTIPLGFTTLQQYCNSLGYDQSESVGASYQVCFGSNDNGGDGYGAGGAPGGIIIDAGSQSATQYGYGGWGAAGLVFAEWTSASNYFYINVKDTSGNILQNATVTAVKSGSSTTQYGYGSFLFDAIGGSAISSGSSYSLTASASGYSENTTQFVYLTPGQTVDVYLSNSIASAKYFYPVTIVDGSASTISAIAGSSLHVTEASVDEWHNTTSATGKFNVTGKGTSGLAALISGDEIILQGSASGYETNGFALTVSSITNGQTQIISLLPSGLVPISGQFTDMVSVYDDDTSAALSGVSLTLKSGNNSVSTKTTGSAGTAVFKNLSAGDTYTLVTSLTGYTASTRTLTGGSGQIVYTDIPMSSISVNPTRTATPTVTATGTANSTDMNETAGNGLAEFLYIVFGMGGIVALLIFLKFVKNTLK